MPVATFLTVLGRPGVIDAHTATADPRYRVLAYDGDTIVGIAGFEPLYGRQAEAAIAVAPASTDALTSYLFDGIIEQAVAAGITVVRFAIDAPHQRACASSLVEGRSAVCVRSDRIEVRTSASGVDRPILAA